jgi:hypothetical protein
MIEGGDSFRGITEHAFLHKRIFRESFAQIRAARPRRKSRLVMSKPFGIFA